MKCCICDKEIKGHGNNPYGALNYYGRPIKWLSEDRCCDECCMEHVIPGRIKLSIFKKL